MRKRRILAGLLAGLSVFAVVVGMAASLGGITAQGLGADDSAITSCDSNGVSTAYTTAYSTTGTAGYKVGNVTVDGIADACNSATMSVTLTGAGGASLAQQSVTVAVNGGSGDTSDTLSFAAANVLAESVTGVHVVIAS